MKTAIIGGGFAGLALCYYALKRGDSVTLFDAGGGASRVATGLVHPYPGERGRLSWRGHEALERTRELLEVAGAKFSRGVVRRVWTDEQRKNFESYPDVVKVDEDAYLISSGLTVQVPSYLEGLWGVCEKMGAQRHMQKVERLEELKDFDHIFCAAGEGSFKFADLPLTRIKGQVLLCKHAGLERSLLAKGHVTPSGVPDHIYVGATYEREFMSAEPDLETAKRLLAPTVQTYFPEISLENIISVQAGVRVMNGSLQRPFVQKLAPNCTLMTGLGSRGLLYHAYIAQQLCN